MPDSHTYYGTCRLSRFLQTLTAPVFSKRGFAEHRILTDWEAITGKVIARYSMPQKLAFPPQSREGGVLHVDVYDSGFATEMHYLGPLILEKIATYFGYPAVARLAIMQKPLPFVFAAEKPVPIPVTPRDTRELQLAGIADPDLKTALASLGTWIKADTP